MTLTAEFNSSVPVPFQRMRALLLEQGGGLQEGAVGATDVKPAQRGAGANLSSDVPAGAAWVQLDTGSRNGVGHVFNDATFNAGPFTAGNGTNPRIDQVILRWNDSSIPTGTGNVPTIEVLTGTATSGATLDNRLGAAALPNDCLRLADVLMPISSTTVTTANIRDRRPWARGAYNRIIRAASSYTTVSASYALIDSTNLQPRIECSGVPLRVTLIGQVTHSTSGAITRFLPTIDGVVAETGATDMFVSNTPASGANDAQRWSWDVLPSAGSHLVGWSWRTSTATATLSAVAATPLLMIVEEIIRPNTSNT